MKKKLGKMFFFNNYLKTRCLINVFFLTVLFLCLPSEVILADGLKEDSLHIDYLNKQGKTALRLGDFDMAINSFEKSITLTEKVYGNSSLQLFAPTVNMGIAYKNAGEYDMAIGAYSSAENLIKNLYSDDYPSLGYVYSNMGTIYKIKGDYIKNNELQEEALRVLLGSPSRYKFQIVIARYSVAESLFLLGKDGEAIADCMKSISYADDEAKPYYTSLLARIYAKRGNDKLMERYYKETFELLKKQEDHGGYDLGQDYSDYVSFLLSIGRFEEVQKYNDLSEKIISKYFTPKSIEYSDVMLNYGDYYFLRNTEASRAADFTRKRIADLTIALGYYQKALVSASISFSSLDPKTNPGTEQAVSEIQMLQILKKKAKCFVAIGDLNEPGQKQVALENYTAALEAITLSVKMIHLIRTGYISEESRLVLSETEESTFVDAVNICYKAFSVSKDKTYADKGFEFAEKSKSASFLAAVKDSRAKVFGGIPDSLMKKEDVLKLNISNYKEMLFEENQQEEPDSAKLALYNSKIFQYSEKYSQLVKYLENYYPDYYSFKYKNDVVSIDSIREKLRGKEAIIEYMLAEPDRRDPTGMLFRFVISDKGLDFSRSLIDSSFFRDIGNVYNFLTNPAFLYTGIKDYSRYSVSAWHLYRDLLGDVREQLEGKRLIVIPDDKLSYIPFDALLSSLPDTTVMNFRDLPYLVKDYAISYTYSATLLYSYFHKKREAGKELLAFAPSYLNDERDNSELPVSRAGLMPLPSVDKEVSYINTFVPGDVFKDSLAQESSFKKLAGDYDILHLAMHTIINDTLPMYSRLAFAKPLPGDPDDGWLNTSEIYNLKLKARMAVLSACNTGSGKLQKGEGVMSLARGFLYAGCPSIIMTLWEVDDESGSLIMEDFYRLLSKGKGKDEALRLAKLKHIENADPLKAHPHYWLGYVAVGNSDPLFVSKDVYFVAVVFGLIILLIIDRIYRRKRRAG